MTRPYKYKQKILNYMIISKCINLFNNLRFFIKNLYVIIKKLDVSGGLL
ncbi:hypothetical protein IYC_06319 [Clostridium sporogenes PA 3679]|nr:hypothetical protein IYC_06319 [Clostridium sporogenes PA 3679]